MKKELDIEETIKVNSYTIVRYNCDQMSFNVEAFDADGKKKWNINDILGLDPKTTLPAGSSFVAIRKAEESSNCFYAWSFATLRYCIDVEKEEVVETIFTK